MDADFNICDFNFSPSESFVEDHAFAGLKSYLKNSYPSRIRSAKLLIESVPYSEARRIIAKNVSLIKTIPSEEDHNRIVAYILQVFLGNRTREQLVAYLMRIGGVDEERAEMIADDQISKASVRFQVEKWKKQGVKKVKWIHSGEPNPRIYHMRRWNGISGKRNGRPNGLNGYIFEIDSPPIINPKTNERGYPGHMINCHCRLEPVHEKKKLKII